MRSRTARQSKGSHILERLNRELTNSPLAFSPANDTQLLLSKLVHFPLTSGNSAELLVNGLETFESIFESIEQAQRYVLVEFYIREARRDQQTTSQLNRTIASQLAPRQSPRRFARLSKRCVSGQPCG